MAGVFDELKRRNVIRVAAAYLIAAWLLLQVTDILVPILSLPESAARFVFLLLIIGFAIALILAWAYELTPDGVKRERNVDRSKSITPVTGRKLDFAIIAMMAVAIVYLIMANYVFDRAPPASANVERSIAVLPFRNRSNVAEDAFFVDGMADDLLIRLSRLSSLDKVISRTSTEQYRDTTKSIPEIGAELNVATILEGGVQRAGDQVRINVQLIDTMTDEHIWAQTYDRELTIENLFDIQSEITREIVTTLHGVLSDTGIAASQMRPTTSMDAYTNYVFGRKELAQRASSSILLAKAYFEKAIELDPGYALAYVGLADTYALHPQYLNIHLRETQDAWQAAVNSALSIDPASGEAYANLAYLQLQQGNLRESEQNFLRAMQLSPGYATSYHWYFVLLGESGRLQEAETQIRKAVELDPLAPVFVTNLGAILRATGKLEEAESVLRDGIAAAPNFPSHYKQMAYVWQMDGRLGNALQAFQAAVKLDPRRAELRENECVGYLGIGDDTTAEQCLDSLQEQYPERVLFGFASLNFYRSQFDEGLKQIDQYVQQLSYPAGRRNQAVNYFFAGREKEARNILEELEPDLYGESEITIGTTERSIALTAAGTLFSSGERDRANYLLDAVLESIRSAPDSRRPYLHVVINVIRGDRQRAIQALREAVDSGWRREWWILRTPLFEPMQEEHEWIEIVDEIEADIANQRQWFEEHQDDPLF